MKKTFRKAVLALAVLAAAVVVVLATTGGLYFAGVLQTTVIIEKEAAPCPAETPVQPAVQKKVTRARR